jgi:hypothetical protein
LVHRQLAQYIAASAPLHCADGWSLLGRALGCHTQGDCDSARHFAYYAELRAALSLLAAEGIGVFDKRHFVVENVRNCVRIRNGFGTHAMARAALEDWANLPRAARLIGGNLLTVGGKPFSDWLSQFLSGASFGPIGNYWLRTWGLDLRLMVEDQNARNESSYRPTRLNQKKSLGASISSDFICALWSLYEPSGQSAFENLDRHLVRLMLEEAFKGVTGRTPAAARALFRKRISNMLSNLMSDDGQRRRWQDFLTRKVEPKDPIIVTESQKKPTINDPRSHLQVISRAALLLRVATGASSGLIREARLSSSDLKFWWEALGRERGLWDTNGEPTELKNLWADIEGALSRIRQWEADNSEGNFSLARWRTERAREVSVLGECERIAVWGIQP